MTGPLEGFKVIELGGIGPGPFTGMMLADMGAEVLRIERLTAVKPGAPANPADVHGRGKRSAAVDLKTPGGRETVLRLVERADALVEGFRPGVTERLGLGPDECLKRNPRLIYGRMTGWGQSGPYAPTAGHDINYIALSGALSLIGRKGEPPVPPINLVGDFGGGGLMLAFGIACALVERNRSGAGQVIDAAMIDGAAILASSAYGSRSAGHWGERGTNVIDTGRWYYEVYETSDGGYISFGSLEPQFYEELLRLTGLADNADGAGAAPALADRDSAPGMKERMTALVKSRTRAEWCDLLEGSDVCFSPVLDLDEAPKHPHHVHRGSFTEIDGIVQPGPAPRFSRTAPVITGSAPRPGEHTDEALAGWGVPADELASLRTAGAIA